MPLRESCASSPSGGCADEDPAPPAIAQVSPRGHTSHQSCGSIASSSNRPLSGSTARPARFAMLPGRGVLLGSAMNKPTRPPLVPEDLKHTRASVYFFRAAAATLHAHTHRCSPERAANELFGRDIVTEIVLKGASNPATIANSNWAGALAATAIEDTVMAISSMSAFAALAQKGLKLDFGNYGQIKAPGRIVDASDGGTFVAEGAPVTI